jgi:hypothetical protein
MTTAQEVACKLLELQNLLLRKKCLVCKSAEPWRNCLTEYGPEEWDGNWIGVYVLWENEDDFCRQRPPVYVGEGIIGTRIWESHQVRKNWQYAQVLIHDLISGGTPEQMRWRKLLERFLIVTLDPRDNIG